MERLKAFTLIMISDDLNFKANYLLGVAQQIA